MEKLTNKWNDRARLLLKLSHEYQEYRSLSEIFKIEAMTLKKCANELALESFKMQEDIADIQDEIKRMKNIDYILS